MKYLDVIVFKIRGVTIPAEDVTKDLIGSSSGNVHAVLTNCPDDFCFECDRRTAVANLMLMRMFQNASEGLDPSRPEESNARIAREMEKERELRKKEFGEGPSLVIKITGTSEDIPDDNMVVFSDFVVRLGDSPRKEIHATSKAVITAILTGLTMAAEEPITAKKVNDGIVFFGTNEKPLYAYDFKLSGQAYVSRAITASTAESMAGWYAKLVADPSIESVVRLLTLSQQGDGDMLRGFLAAWNALEIFIGKTFAKYEVELVAKINEGTHSDGRQNYLKRIGEVMKDKYRITDKFAVVSGQLCPADTDADLAVLQKVKKMRDTLLHGEDVKESELPVVTVQNLVRKYLRLHFQS
jgi:hypothetical protein